MIRLEVMSPEGLLFSCDNATAVFLPGRLFPFEVLTGHAPIISSLDKGEVRCVLENGSSHSVAIESGFVEVKDDVVYVCAEVKG